MCASKDGADTTLPEMASAALTIQDLLDVSRHAFCIGWTLDDMLLGIRVGGGDGHRLELYKKLCTAVLLDPLMADV